MTKANKILIFSVILSVIVVLLLGWRFGLERKPEPSEPSDALLKQEVSQPEEIEINLIIEGFTDPGLDMEIQPGTTVLGVLQDINQENPALNLQTKTYEGLGVLIEGLGDKINGQDSKYWQYYVNGQMPMIGADQYVLEEGDKIEWVFAESEF